MRLFIEVTYNDWFALHSSSERVEEVNYIVGGAFFTRFVQLQVNMTWDVFGETSGAGSLKELRGANRALPPQINWPRGKPDHRLHNACRALFWNSDVWIPFPADFRLNTVQGKVGRIWRAVRS